MRTRAESIRVAWDARLTGLEISFEVAGEIHRLLLTWDRLDAMRRRTHALEEK